VNRLFLEAYNQRATDIHLEPYKDELKIKYRIDGILYDVKMPENARNIQNAVISRLKIMSNLDIAEKRLPQDGRTRINIREKEIDTRISLLPTPFGEAAVIRMLPASNFFNLENLGLLENDFAKIEALIHNPYGIVFATGPTGSGKSTTLYAILNQIKDKEKKIITIEDPIEYQIKGIVQMQVHPKIDFTFAKALPHMLRHDPDVMMVGEVRDQETAETTIRVALTGHLVFSTLHTNDAASGIIRLMDMGIDPYLISSSVNAFIAQRLVRVICGNCKEKAELSKEFLGELDLCPDDVGCEIFKGTGCDSCGNTGYKGRTAIYEILTINDEIREFVLRRSSAEVIKKAAVNLGMRTLRRNGWEKIARGITTPSEVLRVTN
jgi:type II secretory ATPase GspE/PulE/Tfp pilus assembly ATPase PilB-like protein